MASPLVVQSMQEKWKVCEEQEDQKRSLITELFNHIEKLSFKLKESEQSLDEKNVYIQSMRTYKTEAQKQIDELLAEKDNHRFALVVIDGDCMPFKDDLVKQGLEGGKMASGMLKQAVLKELAALGPSLSHHLQIVIQVYANLRGLITAYHGCGILTSSEVVEEFVRGFNMGASLCDFVDAGNGKECADEKVKANFQLATDNVHCKQIIFGGSGDNGYARLLGELLANPVKRDQVILLEGPPFEKELADIKGRFNVMSFPDIFRNQKLSNVKRRVPLQLTPPSTPSVGYAAAAAKGSSTAESPHSVGSQSAAPLALILPLAGVLRNKAAIGYVKKKASDAASLELGEIAAAIRHMTERFTPDAVAAYIHDAAHEVSPQRLWQAFLGTHHTLVTSWVRAKAYELDFFGTQDLARYVQGVMPKIDGLVQIMDVAHTGDFDVSICIRREAMARFLKDPSLREYDISTS
ncbi:CCCH zinc finger DNA binding protein [Colletotrichum karsti]|uniref:CCCH zinc finger DNA binding protein n=1 Tax=Colletotrichum karsti TaxID=1095194 RepID=A0A9P6LL48_9PEZI|nr:CCCH zinc finger DNA binding protein [Colletotrichum karsti]KAF9880064.1 CCCH zinc finger DNA binding protein [Colletotrichum karsti]